MGILGRFEKKVEGAVNGVFARAFKGDVQPVEIAARLQRELDTEAKLMSRDKRLVPNEFTVKLSEHDHEKLVPYGQTLTAELATELRNHAKDMGYVFNGPIRISLELDATLPTGRFTVTSEAVAGVEERPHRNQSAPVPHRPNAGYVPDPSAASPFGAEPAADRYGDPGYVVPGRPTLVLEVNGTRHPLRPPGLTIGRGTEADLRISDPGISRLHAEIRVSGAGQAQQIDIVDLGSTNGITVNGQKVKHSILGEGSRIEIGSTRMLVHAPAGR